MVSLEFVRGFFVLACCFSLCFVSLRFDFQTGIAKSSLWHHISRMLLFAIGSLDALFEPVLQ